MDIEQKPFSDAEFVDNPEPRCACLLLLDTSGSMNGRKISELNDGLVAFEQELKVDSYVGSLMSLKMREKMN